LSPLLQRIYAARGVRHAEQLQLALERMLRVGSLEHVEAAAALLNVHRNNCVVVVGDYDADGATSTALVLRALRAWGFADVDFVVPDRFTHGYGLTPPVVDIAAARGAQLLVTVDNGTSSVAGVQRARELGIAVLVTDHHLPGEQLPAADVIVNPNLPGSQFASRALAGVGVAFYVMAALRRLLAIKGVLPAEALPVTQWLDLVALGTVADLVALDDNNRVLVAEGLKRIRAGRCVPGIVALLAAAKRQPEGLVAADLGFQVAPRLNAAGRLDDMGIGIRCLLAPTLLEAQPLAEQLDQLNRDRRSIESDMQALALRAIAGLDLPHRGPRRHALCLFNPEWHQGVVGLVASRIKDRVRRPVIAFALAGEGDVLRGSARSVAGVHIRDVIEAVATREPDLITAYGGHAMAAGLSLARTHLDRFARAFELEVARWQPDADLDAVLSDGPLTLDELALATAEQLRAAGPWGQGFAEPLFDGRFEIVQARVVGERHVKLKVRPEGSLVQFDAIAFNQLDESQTRPPSGLIEMAYRLDINLWQGERRLQLLVEHLQVP
jgi:single-stranded-DNA-specific exonuclease